MLNRYKLNKVAYTIVIITTNGHVYFTDVNDSIFLVYNYSNLRCDLILLTSVQGGGLYLTWLVNPSSVISVHQVSECFIHRDGHNEYLHCEYLTIKKDRNINMP